ncbi:MAG: hypothetical protein ACI4DY_04725 [Monoglobaceae bacterium]
MRKINNSEGVCPCCGLHCSIDSLHCMRGHKFFAHKADADTLDKKSKGDNTELNIACDEAIGLMLQCGHYLHHGMKDIDCDILSFLSDNEKSELTSLLKKCIEHWNN